MLVAGTATRLYCTCTKAVEIIKKGCCRRVLQLQVQMQVPSIFPALFVCMYDDTRVMAAGEVLSCRIF